MKAAKKRQPFAEFNPGEAYDIGYGRVKENKEITIKWIKSSAEHGDKRAQEILVKIEKWGFENTRRYLKTPLWRKQHPQTIADMSFRLFS